MLCYKSGVGLDMGHWDWTSNDTSHLGDYCASQTPLSFRYNLYKSVMRIIIGDLLDFYTDGVHIFM